LGWFQTLFTGIVINREGFFNGSFVLIFLLVFVLVLLLFFIFFDVGGRQGKHSVQSAKEVALKNSLVLQLLVKELLLIDLLQHLLVELDAVGEDRENGVLIERAEDRLHVDVVKLRLGQLALDAD